MQFTEQRNSRRKMTTGECGCEIPATKLFASKNKCAGCGKVFCGKHLFGYVDEANEAITKNSKDYCKNCYYKYNRYK